MINWRTLMQELDHWHCSGQLVKLWWRDDDADQPGDNLRHLLRLSSDYAVPLGLSVSPALFLPDLPEFVAQHDCTILQHGYAHLNHAPAGQKKCELGNHRPANVITDELKMGAARMHETFSRQFIPVMVPPWNRIADKVVAQLNMLGFTGISTYTARHSASEQGLLRCNTHVDIINWRAGGAFVGTESALALLTHHLTMKRANRADPDEPTGLLTHHQRHDQSMWQFLDDLLDKTCGHPAVRWLAPAKLFAAVAH